MNRVKKLIVLCMSFLGIMSCTKKELLGSNEQQRISYDVLSLKSSSAFPTSMTFFSTAYYLSSGTWTDNKSSASVYKDGSNRLSRQEVKYKGTYWGTDTDFSWPSTGSLTFFSYRQPLVNPTISKDGISFTGWDVSSYKAQDFDNQTILVSDIAADKTHNESYATFSGVPTHFRHKLSKLSFSAAISPLASTGTAITINNMYISGVYLKGDYSKGGYTNDSWSNLKTLSSNYSITTSSVDLSSTLAQIGSDMVMIPQILSSTSKIVIEYTITQDGTTENKSAELLFVDQLRNSEWVKGTSYNYTIYIGVGTYPIEFDGDVAEWTTISQGDIIIGG